MMFTEVRLPGVVGQFERIAQGLEALIVFSRLMYGLKSELLKLTQGVGLSVRAH